MYPLRPLGDCLRYRKEFVTLDDLQEYKRCRVQLRAQGIVLRDVVPGAEIKTKTQQVCRAGELLVAEIDAKLGGFGIVPDELDGAIVSSHYFLFEIDENVLDRQYLGFYLQTAQFLDQVTAKGSTNYAAIRPQYVLGYRIPLPPLAEQRRVVERLREVHSRLDRAQTLALASQDALSALRATAFSERFRALGSVNDVRPLAELCLDIADGPHKTPHYVPHGIPFVTVRNMVSGVLDFTSLQYISPEDHAEFSRRIRPEQGDVLYSKDGATRGRPCLVNSAREFSVFVSVAVIKPRRDVLDGRYFCHLLNSGWIRDRMVARSRGDMIPHIVLGQIRQFPVPLPPLSAQRDLANQFDILERMVETVGHLQRAAQDEAVVLARRILHVAFAAVPALP